MADAVLKLGTEIPGTSAEGNITTIWVPSILDIKHPTLDELNAGTDISNYVMLGGWSFDPSQDTVSDQRENSIQDFGAPGRKSAGDISIEVIDNTNTLHEQDGNAAVELMHEGAEGFVVRRRGMATDAPLAVGQKLTVVAVICGEKHVINPDANTMIRSTIPLFAKAPGWESETAEITDGSTPEPAPTLGTLTVTAGKLTDGKSLLTLPTPDADNFLRYKVTDADELPTVEYDTVVDKASGWEDIPTDKKVAGTAGQVATVVEATEQGAKARKKGQTGPFA